MATCGLPSFSPLIDRRRALNARILLARRYVLWHDLLSVCDPRTCVVETEVDKELKTSTDNHGKVKEREAESHSKTGQVLGEL
jgi:hypothetical protein